MKTYWDGTAEGRPIYRTIDEPEFETRFEYKCVRITYRLFQYDKAGELTGTLDVARTPFQGCPEKTDRDIYLDDLDYLRSWLQTHISTRREGALDRIFQVTFSGPEDRGITN